MMARHGEVHVPIRVHVPPALRAHIDAAQAERRRRQGERMNRALSDMGRRITEAFRPVVASVNRAALELGRAYQHAQAEAARRRWIDHQLYQRVTRPRQVAAFHHDEPLPYGPGQGIDLELELARIQLGVEYDSALVAGHIDAAYNAASARLAELEQRHRAHCQAHPLDGRLPR